MAFDKHVGKPLNLPTVFALLFFASSPGFSQVHSPEQFMKRYLPAAAKLEEFYGKVTIKFKMVSTREKKTVGISEVVFKANRPNFLMEYREIQGTRPRGTVTTRIVNKHGSFGVEKKPGEAFRLRPVETDYRAGLDSMRNFGAAAFAPYCLGAVTVAELIVAPDFVFDRVETLKGEKTLVKLSFQYRELPGWFVFSPDDSWALVEWDRIGKYKARMTYEGKKDGIPLLRSAQIGSAVFSESFEVLEITPGTVSEEEFYPGAFGISAFPQWLFDNGILPNPALVNFILANLALVAMVLLLLYVRRLRKRKRT